jgi:hypothetical protein
MEAERVRHSIDVKAEEEHRVTFHRLHCNNQIKPTLLTSEFRGFQIIRNGATFLYYKCTNLPILSVHIQRKCRPWSETPTPACISSDWQWMSACCSNS